MMPGVPAWTDHPAEGLRAYHPLMAAPFKRRRTLPRCLTESGCFIQNLSGLLQKRRGEGISEKSVRNFLHLQRKTL